MKHNSDYLPLKEKGRGGAATSIEGKGIFLELFNFVDQNNGEGKGIAIFVQKFLLVWLSHLLALPTNK